MAETVLKQMGCEPQVACSWALATERVTASLTALGRPAEALPLLEESIAIYRTPIVQQLTQAETSRPRAAVAERD